MKSIYALLFCVQARFQLFQPLCQGGELFQRGVVDAGLVHIVRVVGGPAVDTDDLSGDTNGGKTINYIKNQSNHHKTMSFQDEYKLFLKAYKVQYDERYVFDD